MNERVMTIKKLGMNEAPLLAKIAGICVLALVCIYGPLAYAVTGDILGVNQALGLNAAPSSSVSPTPVMNGPIGVSPNSASSVLSTNDYNLNSASDVFGAQLFTGAFSKQGATQFNPDYAIATGDQIQVRFWGAFEFDSTVAVDPKGNIFLPHVGPVQVLSVRNEDLQKVVEAAVRKVFRTNVYSYASLAAAQPVRVFVSGFVRRPGLYNGTSMDSLLHYIDQAGGIDPDRGSFLNVQVKRGDVVRTIANLYDFLLDGRLPLVQLADGDVIFVSPRQNMVKVSGLVRNSNRFEFSGESQTVNEVISLAKPLAEVTHARVIRNSGAIKNVEYFPLEAAASVVLNNGDEIEFTADKKMGTITVRVEGEHLSPQEYVLPYGARMGELLKQIQYSDRSDKDSLQLFRRSVKERQKIMLQTALKSLETAALTARSATNDEVALRKGEADLILQWVERAKQVEPTGQVVISQSSSRDSLLLENGDVLRVPTKDGLVLVSGEVLFPNAVAYDDSIDLDEYIRRAGGYTQNADSSRVIVSHRDGSFSEGTTEVAQAGMSNTFWWEERTVTKTTSVRPGDEILILPKIDVKSLQITKDLTQVLYQIAISAKVVLGL